MEITAIEGVGSKTAEALSALDDPERALRDGDVATLAQAPGITEARAARIARAAIRDRHDDPGEFLATPRAREIYHELLQLLEDRTVTDYGAARIETFFPTSAHSRIEEVREFADRAMERDPSEDVLEALADVSPLSTPEPVRVRDRCLATNDASRYSEATAAVPELSVELVDDARKLAELARGYSTVIALDEEFDGVDVEGDLRVQPDALESPDEVVPERMLSYFAHNRETILAAIAVHRQADLTHECDLEGLESALSVLEADGSISGDHRLERLSTALADLDAAVAEAERAANDHLKSAIEQRDVTIEGTDLLSMVEQGAGVNSLLERELAEEYDEAIELARSTVLAVLELEECRDLARRTFGDEVTYPVSHDERAVSRLREELAGARDRRAGELKGEVARQLAGMQAECERLVSRALERDVEYAIARFSNDFACTMPALEGTGISIEAGRSPLLDVLFEDIEPVDYQVNGVTLLSGVNSGGKTSLLDLVAVVAILAHMGLPVPACNARVQYLSELHYHAKTQGTLDAGAFESTLREFGALVSEVSADRPVLVLVDELESITEPGASANIIAGILEALDRRDATAVFVSHLAGEIRDVATTDIAVDGIEADGLEDGELVVDRTPVKDTLARSTPELIVEKLADERDEGGDREGSVASEEAFYRRLLGKFS